MAAKTEMQKSTKAPRFRSPNYPVVNLEKAVEKADQLYRKSQTHPCPIGLAQKLWGYSEHSSSGDQCVAALRAFGVIEVAETGRDRQIRVSETGRRIVLNSMDRPDLLKQAALRPSIHAELWSKYGGNPPADELVRHYLVFDRPEGTFSTEAAPTVIARFRESIGFANLVPGDKMDWEPVYEGAAAPDGIRSDIPGREQVQRPMNTCNIPLTILTDDRNFAVLNIPRMSAKAFDFLKTQLDLFRSAIVIDEAEDPSAHQT